MRMLCERSLEHDNELYICFVDFEKAVDRVKWTKLWHILKTIGIDWRDRRLISNLYLQQEAIIRVGNGYSKPANIGRGLQHLFGNDDDRCYGRDQGRRKASERRALRR